MRSVDRRRRVGPAGGPPADSLSADEHSAAARAARLRVRCGFDAGRLAKSVEQAREFAEVNRFHKVRVKTYGARALMIRRLSVAGHGDEPNPPARAKVTRELIAVHHWQADVEHPDCWGTSSATLNALGPSSAIRAW